MSASGPRRLLFTLIALAIGTSLWLPIVHFVFRPAIADYHLASGVPPMAASLLKAQLDAVEDAEARLRSQLRAANPEWDLMTRTFVVLSLANLAISNPKQRDEYLQSMDRLIDETLRDESQNDHYYFLLSYARGHRWIEDPAKSQFVNSELLMMIAARRLVAEKQSYRDDAGERMNAMIARMKRSPVLCAESYPDECWLFDNAMALAAIRLLDIRDGTDHSIFIREWIDSAKKNLVEPKSGLLSSSFSVGGRISDGPEGSSIWAASHFLQPVDPQFAQDQYRRAKSELAKNTLGFGYAREWPGSGPAQTDVDSGTIIPLVGASPSSSGLACVAAAAFDDDEFQRQLYSTLYFAAFPIQCRGSLRFAASNQMGDAVLLYSTVLGPLWKLAESERKR